MLLVRSFAESSDDSESIFAQGQEIPWENGRGCERDEGGEDDGRRQALRDLKWQISNRKSEI